jgi:hypothetical protein
MPTGVPEVSPDLDEAAGIRLAGAGLGRRPTPQKQWVRTRDVLSAPETKPSRKPPGDALAGERESLEKGRSEVCLRSKRHTEFKRKRTVPTHRVLHCSGNRKGSRRPRAQELQNQPLSPNQDLQGVRDSPSESNAPDGLREMSV